MTDDITVGEVTGTGDATADAERGAATRRSVIESPWYWLYVFCAAAIAALLLMAPRYTQRQVQLERNYQGRERANQRALGQSEEGVLSTADNLLITLRPLHVVLVTSFLVAWFFVWWQHFRPGKVRVRKLPAESSATSSQVSAR